MNTSVNGDPTMAPMEYDDYVEGLKADWPDLADEFAGRDSIEHVLDWMQRRGFPPGSVDMVKQDEFSFDFLVRLEREDRWLVFAVN